MVAPAGVVFAQDAPNTGPYKHDDLVRNGVHDSEAPDSIRMVGNPVRGGIGVRHVPASPLQSEWQYVEPGETIKTDTLQLYATAFGEATGDYELVVVQWTPETRTVDTENGTRQETVAADQTVQRIDIELDNGYSKTDVQLTSQYNETREVTMWLERNGERVDGVAWRFKHTSVASTQQVDIQTQADAWWYAGRMVLLPGIAGIVVGLSFAKVTLRKTGRGPGYGLGAWLLIGGIGLAAALGGAYYEIAAVLANFDMLMGLSLGVVAYGGGLRMHPPVEFIGFERDELTDAVSLRNGSGETPRGDSDAVATDGGETEGTESVIEIPEESYRDELYEDLPRLPTVRGEDGNRFIPKSGVGPFFARLFASAARLDLSSLRTRVRVASGCISEKIYVSPESDEAVNHRPAHLKRRMPVWHRLPEPADEDEQLDTGTRVIYGALTLAALALPMIGWRVGEATMQTPLVGALAGTVLLAIESYGAHDGSVDFDPAPRHYMTAKASLTILQDEHADAKTLEEYEEIAWNERNRTALEARQVESRRDKTTTQQLNENALGMELDTMAGDSATEDEEESAQELLGGPDPTDDGDAQTDVRADGGDRDE